MSPVLTTHTGWAPSPPAPTLGTLGETINRLAEVRAAIKRLEYDEQGLKLEVIGLMGTAGLATVRTDTHLATLGERTTLVVCPYRLFERVGALALDAMTVNLTAARRLLGEDELTTLATRETTAVLRVVGR